MSTMNWNPMTHENYEALTGYDVYSTDNEKLGTIREVVHSATTVGDARASHYFRIEPGMLKKLISAEDEVFISETLVREVQPDNERVVLSVPKSQIQTDGWRRPDDFDSFRIR